MTTGQIIVLIWVGVAATGVPYIIDKDVRRIYDKHPNVAPWLKFSSALVIAFFALLAWPLMALNAVLRKIR